jgi:hypothetical protein
VGVLSPYTTAAEALYRRRGWDRLGLENDADEPAVLMRRVLQPAGPS